MKKEIIIQTLFWAVFYQLAFGATGIPITFTLDKPSFVTLVIDNLEGKRIRNLISCTQFPQGTNTVYWDGYDLGTKINEKETVYDLKMNRVNPGRYVVSGLYHEGIQTFFRAAVYSPFTSKSTPWNNYGGNSYNSGGWIGEHGYPPTGVKFKPKGSGFPYGPDQDIMIVCGHIGETNDLVAWVGMEFNKIHGTKAVSWTGKTGWFANECGPRTSVSGGGFEYRINAASQNIDVIQNGKVIRSIGKAGGIHVGLYDEKRMHNPVSLDLDNRGRLWVAEQDEGPRRVSVWNVSTGELVYAFYGPGHYGGGGIIDPRDSTLFYYSRVNYNDGNQMMSTQVVMQFKIDWSSGQAKPYAIIWRPDFTKSLILQGYGPERVTYINNRQYMYNTHPGFHRHSIAQAGIWMMGENHYLKPVGVVGVVSEGRDLSVKDWTMWDQCKRPEVMAKFPSGVPFHSIMFAWSDVNLNGKADADEFQFKAYNSGTNNSRIQVSEDLSWVNCSALHFDPPVFTEKGVPIWNINSGKYLAKIEGSITSRGPESYVDCAEEGVDGKDGWFIFTGFPVMGYKNGVHKWTIHSSGNGPAARFKGELACITKLIGNPFTPFEGEAGELWAINGEYGNIYLLTTDGMFVTEFGGDCRNTPYWRMKSWSLGMEIKNVTFAQECFYPGICQLANGSVYLIAGHEHSSILQVKGLETIRRFEPIEFEVTSGDLSNIPPVSLPPSRIVSEILYVGISETPPKLDGNLEEWDTTAFVSIDAKASAALMVSQGNLYMAYRTADPEALINGGGQNGNISTLFKTGGGLDLFLATDSMSTSTLSLTWRSRTLPAEGDLRLLVTQVGDSIKAALYQPVVKGTPEEQKTVYVSSIGQTVIDKITDVSKKVKVVGVNGNFECSVPLSTLGIEPTKIVNLLNTMGDIGILRGNNGQTAQRVYWRNKNTSIVSDIPSEARFQPNQWGLIRFKSNPGVALLERGTISGERISKPYLRYQKGIISLNFLTAKKSIIEILTSNGKVVLRQQLTEGMHSIEVPKQQGNGLLLYRIISGFYVITDRIITVN